MSNKFAILMTFDYQRTLSKSGTPCGLLGMKRDLERSYKIATTLCKVPQNNVTIITDISEKYSKFSWSEIENPPNHIELLYPSINAISETLIKVMIYINSLKIDKIELFVYYSGHGMIFTNPNTEYRDEKIPSLILVDNTGKERRYLSRRELVNIFYSNYKKDELGIVKISTISRKKINTIALTNYTYSEEHILVDTENNEPVKNVNNINVFFIYDACHAGALSGLKYRYVEGDDFVEVHKDNVKMQFSAGVGATNDKQEAPSCSAGSPFTTQMYNIIEKRDVSKSTFHTKNLGKQIKRTLHPLLRKRCTPTISLSHPNEKKELPLIN